MSGTSSRRIAVAARQARPRRVDASAAPEHSCSSNEVERWKEKDPDDIDEVPVESRDFDRQRRLCGEATTGNARPDEAEEQNSDRDMQAVEACHHEIKPEE